MKKIGKWFKLFLDQRNFALGIAIEGPCKANQEVAARNKFMTELDEIIKSISNRDNKTAKYLRRSITKGRLIKVKQGGCFYLMMAKIDRSKVNLEVLKSVLDDNVSEVINYWN